jgi:hypothetical protein
MKIREMAVFLLLLFPAFLYGGRSVGTSQYLSHYAGYSNFSLLSNTELLNDYSNYNALKLWNRTNGGKPVPLETIYTEAALYRGLFSALGIQPARISEAAWNRLKSLLGKSIFKSEVTSNGLFRFYYIDEEDGEEHYTDYDPGSDLIATVKCYLLATNHNLFTGISNSTVGPVPLPWEERPELAKDKVKAILDRLDGYVSACYENGWIENLDTLDRVCGYLKELRAKAADKIKAKAVIRDTLAWIEPYRDSDAVLLSETYALLRFNLEYIRDTLLK